MTETTMTDIKPIAQTPYASDHHAPYAYFDYVSAHGIAQGIAEITLEARRLRCSDDGAVLVDRVMMAHLRCGLPALLQLRHAIDSVLLMNEPVSEGSAH